MNKNWAQRFKNIQALLKKESTFKDGLTELIEFRNRLFKTWMCLKDDLTKDQICAQPFVNKSGYESKTIAYSIYHVFRIEDIVLHTLILNEKTIYINHFYQSLINSPIKTTGNELEKDDIQKVTSKFEIAPLFDYAKVVFTASNTWLKTLKYQDLKQSYNELNEQRIVKTMEVDPSKEGLIKYWCNKNILGLILMPFSRHHILHLEASLRIKAKLLQNKTSK